MGAFAGAFVWAFAGAFAGAFVGAFVGAFAGAWVCTAHAFRVGTLPQSFAVAALGRMEHFHLEAGPAAEGPPHPEE